MRKKVTCHCERAQSATAAIQKKRLDCFALRARNDGGAPRNDRAGFTLAEVLITLGIIGVVAALTLPPLITKYKKQQTVTKLKKVYSILNQAYKQSQVENGESYEWQEPSVIGINNYFDQYWKPYLKIIKECFNAQSCGYKNTSDYPWKNPSGQSGWIMIDSNRKSFLLADGVLVQIIVIHSGTTPGDWVNIDLNAGSGPNIYGKDVFCFEGDRTRGILVPLTRAAGLSALSCQAGGTGNNGMACAAKIIQDGWEIKSDYPW
jgi:prepilin-type N-terminal cleavage/methylation domain-containing protein